MNRVGRARLRLRRLCGFFGKLAGAREVVPIGRSMRHQEQGLDRAPVVAVGEVQRKRLPGEVVDPLIVTLPQRKIGRRREGLCSSGGLPVVGGKRGFNPPAPFVHRAADTP